uniref:methyl-accepting chemotaxis protein n=1 Tax=uncultured Flavonifractor sp. TaxID=1193534 RepID=UPI0026365431|nr:methyl-accepting chemotaxis protein [uncultured Flavonifractor sp.]
MKSIRQKLLVCFLGLAGAAALICGAVGIAMSYSSSQSTLQQSMTTIATLTSDRVSYQLQSYKNAAEAFGMVPKLSDPNATVEDKKALLDSWVEHYGMMRGNVLTSTGVSLFDGNSYADREYFQQAIQGNTYISTPTISKITGELSIMVAAPLWQDGIQDSKIVGVVYFVPKETFLNDIMSTIHISEHSGAYMLDKNGTTIAHKNIENVHNQENTAEEAKTNSSLSALAALESKMVAGENGFGQYTYNGATKYLAFAPVDGTDGWSVAVSAYTSDYMATTIRNIIIIAILVAVVIVVAVIISVWIANSLSKPIRMCVSRIQQLQEGDLSSPIPDLHRKDEIGLLNNATRSIVSVLQGIIQDMDYLLDEMAKGNLNVRSRAPEQYVGDMYTVLTNLRKLALGLSDTMSQIRAAANQVSAGAEQVSSGAQALAQGATEQASAVQELSATISDISNSANTNTTAAKQAQEKANLAGSQVTESNEKMGQLKQAMADISKGQQEIGQIIETIENIAFQTNILALNAAVEAARAGSAGKGFAVVADEVRSLASKSDQAAKQTKEMIERSMRNVERGGSLTDEVSAALEQTVTYTEDAVNLMNQVAENIVSDTDSIHQVSEGTDQISSVVQTNSATAEQSAAASQELSGQSLLLKELVGRFTLHSDANSGE